MRGSTCPALTPEELVAAGDSCRTVVRFTPTEFFVGREQTGSLTVRATDPDTGTVKETVIPVTALARTDNWGGTSMRRMVGKSRQMCGGRISRGRRIVHGAWFCANCIQYISDESRPPRTLLPENSPLLPNAREPNRTGAG